MFVKRCCVEQSVDTASFLCLFAVAKAFGGGCKTVIFGSYPNALPLFGTACIVDVREVCAVVKRHSRNFGGEKINGNGRSRSHGRIAEQSPCVSGIENTVNVAKKIVVSTDRNINEIRTSTKSTFSYDGDA